MKKNKHRLLHLLIAAIAIVNLGFLFVFQYGLSNATPAVQAAVRASEERAAYDKATGFDTRVSASENGALIVTNGEAGEDTEDSFLEAAAEVSDTSAASAAEVSMIPEEDDEEESTEKEKAGERESLSSSTEKEQEKGEPSLTLDDSSLPQISYKDLPKLATILTDLDMLSAEDAFGNDLSDNITVQYEATESDSLEFNVTFSVDVPGGKPLTEERKITVTSDQPILELTKDKVTVALNSDFDYTKYIKIARDVNGTRLGDYVSLSGSVDPYNAGTYELTYSLTSWVNSETVQKKLTVVVE
ncbi:MAG: hypothetical protein IKF90_02500 [Parasporobacterium sp.]|nr:hypothetical protein [Parasporobacterium sp.]